MTEAKKSLGQHWLRDEGVLQAIVDAANIQVGSHVLEIGPGQGSLTEKLVATGADVTALEFDPDLIPHLNYLARAKKFTVLEGDIRTFDYSSMPAKYKIVANIPYYLTSHLIRSISETTNPPDLAVLLIQKEVAERLCAEPGQMSILAVTAQFYFECTLDIEVPAKFFTPLPKVDSQVVVLRRREKKLFDVDAKDFFRLVKAGFSEKRKTLRNSLSGGLGIEKSEAEELLAKAGLSPTKRAQELSLGDWHKIYCVVGSR